MIEGGDMGVVYRAIVRDLVFVEIKAIVWLRSFDCEAVGSFVFVSSFSLSYCPLIDGAEDYVDLGNCDRSCARSWYRAGNWDSIVGSTYSIDDNNLRAFGIQCLAASWVLPHIVCS